MLAVLTVVVGVLLGVGAVQELYIRGIVNHEGQPFAVGLLGAITSLLLIAAGAGIAGDWAQRRTIVLVAATLSLIFHAYAALPPHRNVGIAVLVIATGYGLLLLAVSLVGRDGARTAADAAG